MEKIKWFFKLLSNLDKVLFHKVHNAPTSSLAQSGEAEAAILASIGDGVVAVDKDEVVIMMNGQASKMLGWKIEEAIGKPIADVIPVMDKDGNFLVPEKRPIWAAMKYGKSSASSDFLYQRKDKTKFPVSVTVSPAIVDGKIVGAIKVFRDITEQKEMEEVKKEAVSLASHQLLSPSTAVNWYTELLLSENAGEISDKQKKYLEAISKYNKTMVELINTILNSAKVDSQSFTISPQEINLAEAATKAIDEIAPQAQNKKIKIEKKFSPNLPSVLADPVITHIIFQNLLTNANKYTPSGGSVTVSLEANEKEFVISVSDTGYGIPKEAQDKMFTKFFRADNIKDKEPSGTGLGLFMVKAILDQAGCKIWFKSASGKGTTFFVSIPRSGMRGKAGSKELAH